MNELQQPGFPLAPWHMWGTTVEATVVSGAVGPANETVEPTQLARIDYRRPENWRFLLTGRLMGGDVAPGAVTQVHALFDVFVGIGRGVLDTQKQVLGVPVNFNAFAIFTWQVPAGVVPGQQNYNLKYATSVPSPPLDDNDTTVRQVIDHLPAQNITCRARLVMSGGAPGVSVTAELGAFFAPNVHVRPEWFDDDNLFRGNETGGT